MLDYRKGAPALYLQIKDILRQEIFDGLYPLGTYIPTETELEKKFDVSKITIRKAIQDLEDEGYLLKKKGKGTLVIQNNYFNKLSKAKSYSQKLEELGFKLSKAEVTVSRVDTKAVPGLEDYFATQALCVSRVILADNDELTYIQTYLPATLGLPETASGYKDSLYRLLSDLGATMGRCEDRFSVEYASDEVAAKLNIPAGQAILKRIRIGYDQFNQVIEYSLAYYPTTIQPYIVEMEK